MDGSRFLETEPGAKRRNAGRSESLEGVPSRKVRRYRLCDVVETAAIHRQAPWESATGTGAVAVFHRLR